MTAAWTTRPISPKKPRDPRHRDWTTEERERLRGLRAAGISIPMIAQRMDRTLKSIRNRIETERKIDRGEPPRARNASTRRGPGQESRGESAERERPEWSSDGRPRIGRRDPLLEALTRHHTLLEIINAP